MDIADPDELVTFAVDPSGGAQSFFTGYNNPTVVKLSHQAQQELEPGEAPARSTRRSSGSRRRTRSWGSSTTRRSATPTSTSVHGFFVYPLGNYHLEDVWLSN